MVDIEGVSALVDFKVIEIVDENNRYPMLLGIDWATDTNRVINLKKRKMIFEKTSLCVVVPLDLVEGFPYTEPVHNDERNDALDCIYKLITWEQDWVNPTADGRISWEHKRSCTSDSDEET